MADTVAAQVEPETIHRMVWRLLKYNIMFLRRELMYGDTCIQWYHRLATWAEYVDDRHGIVRCTTCRADTTDAWRWYVSHAAGCEHGPGREDAYDGGSGWWEGQAWLSGRQINMPRPEITKWCTVLTGIIPLATWASACACA